MRTETFLRWLGLVLTAVVIVASVYAGYRIYHEVNPDPWSTESSAASAARWTS